MAEPPWITYAILVPIGALLLIWLIADLVIVSRYGLSSGYTISWSIYSASKAYPGVPFLTGLVLGLLCGHLFLGMPGE